LLGQSGWRPLLTVLPLLAVCSRNAASTYRGTKSTTRDGKVHGNSGHDLFPAGSTTRERNPVEGKKQSSALKGERDDEISRKRPEATGRLEIWLHLIDLQRMATYLVVEQSRNTLSPAEIALRIRSAILRGKLFREDFRRVCSQCSLEESPAVHSRSMAPLLPIRRVEAGFSARRPPTDLKPSLRWRGKSCEPAQAALGSTREPGRAVKLVGQSRIDLRPNITDVALRTHPLIAFGRK
jgi:hypothetical protein